MELLQSFNIQIELIIAIVGVVEAVKDAIEKRQLSIYVLLTLLLSIIIGVTLTESSWKDIIVNGIMYFGITTLFYKIIVRAIEKKIIQLKRYVEEYQE